jgi:hypothetical protein
MNRLFNSVVALPRQGMESAQEGASATALSLAVFNGFVLFIRAAFLVRLVFSRRRALRLLASVGFLYLVALSISLPLRIVVRLLIAFHSFSALQALVKALHPIELLRSVLVVLPSALLTAHQLIFGLSEKPFWEGLKVLSPFLTSPIVTMCRLSMATSTLHWKLGQSGTNQLSTVQSPLSSTTLAVLLGSDLSMYSRP